MESTARWLLGAAMMFALLSVPPGLHAENFPAHPIRFLLGNAPGSVLDVATRQLASRLEVQTGQHVIVENRPSAGGIIALETLKNSPADGYTLTTVSMPQMSISPSIFAHLPFDPSKDFAPVGILFRGPQVLVVNAEIPAATLKEFVALAAARPGGLRFSSPANGSPSHVLMEEVRFRTGASLQHIPYKGPSANLAVASGEVDALLEGISQMLPLVRAGKVRPLAVSGDHRVDAMPEVPTFAELGIPDIDAVWVGVIAPRNTPPAIIEYLNAQLSRAIQFPELRATYEQVGRIIAPGSPQEMAATIEAEIPRWRAMVKHAGITPN